MDSETDRRMLARALELAMRGRGIVEPNPMVGCVLTRDGRIICEGRTQKIGGPHAEPTALANCSESPAGATAYVNLEPCCHLTKRTPPCAPRLIEAKIARVVLGCHDPNPLVSGQGVAQLRAAGIEVTEHVLEKESRQLNAAFFKHIEQRRPYVTLKWAQTADGKIGSRNHRLKISNEVSNRIVHKLRSLCDAILIGVGTLLADDPLLTVRETETSRHPMRVLLDTNLRTPMSSRLIQSAADARVLIYCSQPALSSNPQFNNFRGVDVHAVPLESDGSLSLPHVLNDLGGRSVTNLLVEPGAKLGESFLRTNLADRVWVIRSSKVARDADTVSAPVLNYPKIAEVTVAGDHLSEHLNPASEVYFAPEKSADFRIAETIALTSYPGTPGED